MKVVFKMVLVTLALLCAPVPARAQAVYFTTRDLLTDFFQKSQRVTYRKVELSSADRTRLKGRLGYEPAKGTYTFFVAETNGKVDGYALIDEENGEHMPITFAVKISPEGKIERQEIVEYREARGDEVRDLSFRKQFVGKTAIDPLCADRDIAVVSGATISSRAMAIGVKRAMVLFDQFVRPGTLAARTIATPGSTPGKL